jgi:4-hydroxy-2-oxoheptanedioate aldolase
MWRETRYEAQRTPDESNASVICLVMVETMEAVRVLPEILAIPGLGGIFIGPNDLALSAGLGRSSYRDSAEVDSLLQDILDECADADKPAGLYCSDPEMARHWSTRGATFTTIGRDSALYLQALQGGLAVARGERSTDTATPPLKVHR